MITVTILILDLTLTSTTRGVCDLLRSYKHWTTREESSKPLQRSCTLQLRKVRHQASRWPSGCATPGTTESPPRTTCSARRSTRTSSSREPWGRSTPSNMVIVFENRIPNSLFSLSEPKINPCHIFLPDLSTRCTLLRIYTHPGQVQDQWGNKYQDPWESQSTHQAHQAQEQRRHAHRLPIV